MSSPPGGTVTFLFTDIEGSTKSWEQHPDAMRQALTRHDMILREAIEANGGYVFKTVGDAFCAAFPTSVDALAASLSIHRALQAEDWSVIFGKPETVVRVRVGLHTGIAQERDGDYFGSALNRVARLMSAGHGGQTLLSRSTYELVRDNLPAGVQLFDLGEHRLKDLFRPEHIFQLVAPDLPSTFPPLKTLDYRPNNLPVQPTPLIGREEEVAAIQTLLGRQGVRLATLTGPGGTGKTRLALQVGADILDSFRDGVFFVNLAPITDTNLVASEIAQTLGVRESGSRPLLESLQDYFREKETLLILDNFEQIPEAAPVLSQLLSASSHLKLIVTSRARLQLRGEHEYAVPPLGLPDTRAGHLPPLEKLTQYEAVRLFIERATELKPDFQVTNDNAPSVAEICTRLDGLPLAIELAAARIKMLPPQAMLTRLQNRLKVLTGGAKDLPARQQTLRNAIEWSYDLLDEEEKKLFRRLAVFVGGRTLEAIEALCNAEGDLGVEVLDGVSSLMDKSLMRQEEGAGGEPRFVMLETIHEYAWEKLEESGEADKLRTAHGHYFAALVEEAEPHLKGHGQLEWLDKLDEEHDNIRAAIHWSVDTGQPDTGLAMVSMLGPFWDYRGYWTEGNRQTKLVLELAERDADNISAGKLADHVPTSQETDLRLINLLARGHVEASRLAPRVNEFDLAMEYAKKARALALQTDDKCLLADASRRLGAMEGVVGHAETAMKLIEESVVISRSVSYQWGIAEGLERLGFFQKATGNIPAARRSFEESYDIFGEIGDKIRTTHLLLHLAATAIEEGNYTAARHLVERYSLMAREVKNKLYEMWSANLAGELERILGNYEEAKQCYRRALVICRDIGSSNESDLPLANMAHAMVRSGDSLGASVVFRDSLRKYGTNIKKYDYQEISSSLMGLGGVATNQHQAERAACLLSAADAVIRAIGSNFEGADRMDCEYYVATAHAEIDEPKWEAAWAKGQSMSTEEAVDYALEGDLGAS